MQFFRKTAKYTLFDNKINQNIMKELKTKPVLEKINDYRNKRIQHVHRMDTYQLPYAVMKYQPAGKRNPGCPL
jgi:hypothetical protein